MILRKKQKGASKKPGFRIRVDIAGSGSDLVDIAGSGSDPTKRDPDPDPDPNLKKNPDPDPDPDPPKMYGSGSDLKIISKKFYCSNMILVQ